MQSRLFKLSATPCRRGTHCVSAVNAMHVVLVQVLSACKSQMHPTLSITAVSAVILQVLCKSKSQTQADSVLLPALLPVPANSSDTQTDHAKARQKDTVEICCNALYDMQDCADSLNQAEDHILLGKSLEVAFSEEVKENMSPGNLHTIPGVRQQLSPGANGRLPLQSMHLEPSSAATASPLGLLPTPNTLLHHEQQRFALLHCGRQPNTLLHDKHQPSSPQMSQWWLNQPSAQLISSPGLVQPGQQLPSHGTRFNSPRGSTEMGFAEQGAVSQDSFEAFRELLEATQQQRVSTKSVLCV